MRLTRLIHALLCGGYTGSPMRPKNLVLSQHHPNQASNKSQTWYMTRAELCELIAMQHEDRYVPCCTIGLGQWLFTLAIGRCVVGPMIRILYTRVTQDIGCDIHPSLLDPQLDLIVDLRIAQLEKDPT